MQVSLRKSIATQLLRVVFYFYLLVAIVVTVTQMYFEYQHAGDQVNLEIKKLHKSYAHSIARSVWSYNTSQIQSILIGINEIASVSGVSIIDDNNRYNIGIVKNKNNIIENYNSNNVKQQLNQQSIFAKLLSHEFPIVYFDGKDKKILGNLIIYSSTEYVFEQVKYGFFLIITNSIIKTVALWLIFVYFLRRILGRPLSELAHATKKIDLDNVTHTKIEIHASGDNEFKALETAFNAMLNKLATAKFKLDHINLELEKKVAKRTMELENEVAERIKAQKEAEAANELKSLFLANMSHEIRTPMTCMLGMAKILENQENDEQKKQRLQLVVRNGNRLLTLINDILDISKLESTNLKLDQKAFNIRQCVASNVELLLLQANEKQLKMQYTVDDNVPELYEGDENRLSQVLTNLIGNAIKFTDKGTVGVSVSLDVKSNKLLFEISDTGIGIAEDYKETIFNVFTQADATTSRKYGGTGLGLAICKRLVNLMGGELWYESQPGYGSTFFFTLANAQSVTATPVLLGVKAG